MAPSSPRDNVTVAAYSQRTIAFVDLAAQQARIRDNIDLAIRRVLDHGQYIMGPEVATLERRLAAFCGAPYAISCASGTDALLIAMMALGVGRGDAVICPSFTYPATPETIALLGATPVFVDVDPESFNVAPAGLEAGLAAACSRGLRPRGMIVVDLFGQPANYATLEPFARAHELFLLCDAAQSFGASSGDRHVGTFGGITATSFFPAKPLGCYGDGGALFTADDELAARMDSIRLHGKAIGGDKYDIERIGVNGRLDTLQAAILIEKIAIFADEIERRNAIAHRYTTMLDCVVTVPRVPTTVSSVWAQYTVRVDASRRASIMAALKEEGVPTAVYYPRPLHLQAAYREFPVATSGLAVSERLSEEVLSLPMHPYLSVEEQDRIVGCLRQAATA